MGWYQLFGLRELHQYLEYDDGVWFGTSVRLAHGIFPYRNFVDDQPPGVPVAMLPFALWSRSVGTTTAFAAARAVVPLVETVGVVALGWMLRHHGALTVAVACGAMAVYPVCLIDQRTVMLEPFCATLCVLGLAAVFDRDRLSGRTGRASGRRRLLRSCLLVQGLRRPPFRCGGGRIPGLACAPAPGSFSGGHSGSPRSGVRPVLRSRPWRLRARPDRHPALTHGECRPLIYDRLTSLIGSPPSEVPTPLPDPNERTLAVLLAVVVVMLVVGGYVAERMRARRHSTGALRPAGSPASIPSPSP